MHDSNQLSELSSKPIDFNLPNQIVWWTVSNALLISRKMDAVTRPLSAFAWILPVKKDKAMLVYNLGLKLN